MLTAIDCVKNELRKIQQAQAECVDDNGVIKNSMRYRYKMLVSSANEYKRSLEYLENMKRGG